MTETSRFTGMTPAERVAALREDYALTGVMPEEYHGKTYGVTVYKCECERCQVVRERIGAQRQRYKEQRRQSLTEEDHGTNIGALTAYCDCDKCRAYRAAYQRNRRSA